MSSDIDFTWKFRKISFNLSSKNFYYDGKDIYKQPYNEDVVKELKLLYRMLDKKIYKEKMEQDSVEKSEIDYLLPVKSKLDVTINVDGMIDYLSGLNMYPFIVLGERAIYESAKSIRQSNFFDREITTLSIYQKVFDSNMFEDLKKINRFAEYIVDQEYLKIIRIGKIKIEILNKKEDNIFDLTSISGLVEYFRHSGVFYSTSSIGEGDSFAFINTPYHLAYRLVLMLSRKTVLDKERKLVNILVTESIQDEELREKFIKVVADKNIKEIVSKSLDLIHTENAFLLKNHLEL